MLVGIHDNSIPPPGYMLCALHGHEQQQPPSQTNPTHRVPAWVRLPATPAHCLAASLHAGAGPAVLGACVPAARLVGPAAACCAAVQCFETGRGAAAGRRTSTAEGQQAGWLLPNLAVPSAPCSNSGGTRHQGSFFEWVVVCLNHCEPATTRLRLSNCDAQGNILPGGPAPPLAPGQLPVLVMHAIPVQLVQH